MKPLFKYICNLLLRCESFAHFFKKIISFFYKKYICSFLNNSRKYKEKNNKSPQILPPWIMQQWCLMNIIAALSAARGMIVAEQNVNIINLDKGGEVDQ